MMYFTRGGVRLAYEETGTGLPVILIHGFPFSRQMWRPQAPLARTVRLITPDLRGFGESEGTPSSLDELADDLQALVEHLGLTSAVFGGFSMGGYVLFRYLARHADRAKPVLLLDTRAEDDKATPVTSARTMQAAIRSSRLVIIPEAGHASNLEQPERFNAALLEFLQTLR